MSSTELAKAYEPSAVEAEAYRVWLDENCFTADPSHPGKPYSIVIPPPNVTGALHLGHAINNTLQDILTRVHRMRGFNTVWIPGIDHAGIATQAVVEKQLKEKEGLDRHKVGREGLVERIWAWKQQYGDRILSQLQRLGCSCDWTRTRFTLDDMCAKAVRETFFKLFKDGLVYRGKRLVNWDTHLQTSISDDEIYHENVKTFLWHIKYEIVSDLSPSPGKPGEGRGEGDFGDRGGSESNHPHPSPLPAYRERGPESSFMTVATTRPETLLGDTAVAVHSEDARWNKFIGHFVKLPLTDRLIPIIADDILVDPKFGSGVVKVTPAHDPNDYAVYQRHLGKPDAIDIINLMNPDGTLNTSAGERYAGLTMSAARKKVVEDLTAAELLVKEEPYETQVGHSDRSKTAIQPYLSDQWFVKMAPLAEPALEVVRDGTIKFFPERHAQQYLSWLGEKRDWPISRQLWWGHRIPIWTQKYRPPTDGTSLPELNVPKSEIAEIEMQGEWDAEEQVGILNISLSAHDPVVEEYLAQRGFVQDPDVLDTWFSSALWPHSTLGWPEQTADLAKWYPTSVLMTGRDIITLWVARMVMMGMYNMGERRETRDESKSQPSLISPLSSAKQARNLGIPFIHVAINPTILDGKGERMSKSKGNGVDPVDIIDGYGADALRFTLTQMATETQDARMPVKKDAVGRNTSDKFDVGRNFCNKLWNAARFALSNLELGEEGRDERGENYLSPLDKWIISRFNRAVHEADESLKIYRFDAYAKVCYDFFWRDFCDWYVEAIKPAMKDPARSGPTSNVLAAVLDGMLRLLHPMIPFITETIWWRLNEVRPRRGIDLLQCIPSKRLIKAAWPEVGAFDESTETTFAKLQEIIVAIRNVRNEYKVDQKKPVTVSIVAAPETKPQIIDNRELIELLGNCELHQVETELTAPANAAKSLAAGCEIFVENVVDADAEKLRLAKQCETLKQKATAMKARLANDAYAKKAPAHLVQQTRDELAAVEAEMVKLGCVD